VIVPDYEAGWDYQLINLKQVFPTPM
jgi:hypothetical protein